MASDISKAIQMICDEKGLEYQTVLLAVEAALAAAYRKDFGNRQQNIKVKFDPETADTKAWDVKTVVEDIDPGVLEKAQEELTVRREAAQKEGRELTEEETADLPRFNPKTEMMLSEAKTVKSDAALGEVLEIPLEIPSDFGRMAAQTAKQVIIQKLREAERNTVFDDFKKQENQMVSGIVQRRDRSGMVIVDLGKITGLVPVGEQIRREAYRPGSRMRFFVMSVSEGMRGPEIILSRASSKMVEVIFAQEIPEVAEGSVVIKTIARDAGNRSKVAVWTDDDSIDPIGSCIGQRGGRITTIIQELGGEKIDIIQWSDKPEQFIQHALSPAKVKSVEVNEETKEATAHVGDDQFSLAIGRGGQNVRLAAALSGYKITVVQDGEEPVAVTSEDDASAVDEALQPPAETTEEAPISPEDVLDEMTKETD